MEIWEYGEGAIVVEYDAYKDDYYGTGKLEYRKNELAEIRFEYRDRP